MRALVERGDLVAALSQKVDAARAVREWAQKEGKNAGVGLIEVHDISGRLIERTGEGGIQRLDSQEAPVGLADALQGQKSMHVIERLHGLSMRAVAPIVNANKIIGVVVVEADRRTLSRRAGNRIGVEVSL